MNLTAFGLECHVEPAIAWGELEDTDASAIVEADDGVASERALTHKGAHSGLSYGGSQCFGGDKV